MASPPATDVRNEDRVGGDAATTPSPTRIAARTGSGTLAAIVVGMLAAAIYRRGAFYPSDAFGVAIVSGILSVLALARGRDRLSVLLTATVGGLALWWLVRSAAVHRPAAFLPLGASMLGFLAAALVVKELDDSGRARVALALVGVTAVTAALGVVGLVWQVDPLAQRAGSFWQLATPLTHPAAAAALLGVALVLALGLDLRQPLVRGALCLVVAAFIGTQSHWTLLALAAGACLVPTRRWLAAAWPLAAGVLAGVVVVAAASGHLGPWPSTILLAALVAAAGLRAAPRWGRATVPTGAAVVVVVVVLAGLAVLLLRPPGVAGPAQPPSQGQTLAWSAAAHSWRSSTTGGVGPPTVDASSQPVDRYPGLTPDTYLSVLADAGLVGAVLLVGAVTTAAWGCRRRDVLTSCAAGAAVTFAVAGAISPSWELPAVAILGGCAVGLASVATGTTGARATPQRVQRMVGAGAWGVAVVALVVTQTSVGFARDAGGGLDVAQSNAPPPTPTPSAPARYVLSGPDASDPYMTEWHKTYYIYTNQSLGGLNVPVRTGPKPGQWGPPVDALPLLPGWAAGGLTWAPDVHKVAGGWALYYSVLLAVNPSTHCIGAAFGSSPEGPFVPVDHPLVCQLDHRGSIDPRVFVDGPHLILLWKSEDNANPSVPGPDQDGDTGIYAQELSADGKQLLGAPVKILGPSQAWEGTIVEAPDMVEAWGTYWLFFSGNWFTSPSYGIGVAACETPFGPCSDVSPKPFVGSNGQGFGPGEESVFEKGSNVYLLYNPFRASSAPEIPHRPAVMARVGFTPEGPYLAAP